MTAATPTYKRRSATMLLVAVVALGGALVGCRPGPQPTPPEHAPITPKDPRKAQLQRTLQARQGIPRRSDCTVI
jgi:hypothetical protein